MASLAQIDEWHYVGDPGEPAFENGWATQPGLTALA